MRRLAVLGDPVSHSRSPAIHNAAFAALGIEAEWSYEAIEVSPPDFEPRVRSMPDEGFVGANVTVPHKAAAMRVADSHSEVAREIGAANTLSFGAGSIHADNTDAVGLMEALPEPPVGRRALVLGAGGAARAVVWALVRAGAETSIWNRTDERAAGLAAELGGGVIDSASLEQGGPGAFELIVNATMVGLRDEDPFAQLPLRRQDLGPGQVVVDLVYGERPSELLRAATEAGAQAVDGLEVLVRQGAASFRIWTGREPPLEAMRAASA